MIQTSQLKRSPPHRAWALRTTPRPLHRQRGAATPSCHRRELSSPPPARSRYHALHTGKLALSIRQDALLATASMLAATTFEREGGHGRRLPSRTSTRWGGWSADEGRAPEAGAHGASTLLAEHELRGAVVHIHPGPRRLRLGVWGLGPRSSDEGGRSSWRPRPSQTLSNAATPRHNGARAPEPTDIVPPLSHSL